MLLSSTTDAVIQIEWLSDLRLQSGILVYVGIAFWPGVVLASLAHYMCPASRRASTSSISSHTQHLKGVSSAKARNHGSTLGRGAFLVLRGGLLREQLKWFGSIELTAAIVEQRIKSNDWPEGI